MQACTSFLASWQTSPWAGSTVLPRTASGPLITANFHHFLYILSCKICTVTFGAWTLGSRNLEQYSDAEMSSIPQILEAHSARRVASIICELKMLACRGIGMFRAIAGLARDESIAITGGSFLFLVVSWPRTSCKYPRSMHPPWHCHAPLHMLLSSHAYCHVILCH